MLKSNKPTISSHYHRARRALVLAFAVSALNAATTAIAAEDTFPNKPIKIVLGFSAGGGTDAIARSLAMNLNQQLGVGVVVENRAGANGNIASELVANAPADGYTLLYNTSSLASSPAWYGKKLKYDAKKDFAPVARTASLPIVLVVPKNSRFQTVQELVAYLKANPGKLNYGSAGSGNVTHLAALSFEHDVGVKGVHIPYKGESQVLADLMGGHIEYYFATSAGAIPAVKGGMVRALAVATKKRLTTLPDVPTLDETVAPGLEMSAWSGIMAPAKTPKPVIDKLNRAINDALADPKVKEFFEGQSALATPSTPDQYASFLEKETADITKVIETSGVAHE
ncbi:Bug family tripartite tricarboxylate transporter substrate binding protein [Achromobacter aloeverae]